MFVLQFASLTLVVLGALVTIRGAHKTWRDRATEDDRLLAPLVESIRRLRTRLRGGPRKRHVTTSARATLTLRGSATGYRHLPGLDDQEEFLAALNARLMDLQRTDGDLRREIEMLTTKTAKDIQAAEARTLERVTGVEETTRQDMLSAVRHDTVGVTLVMAGAAIQVAELIIGG